MSECPACEGVCARKITWAVNTNYGRFYKLSPGGDLDIRDLPGEPLLFSFPGSCVILGRLHPQDHPVDADPCWTGAETVEIVSVSEDGSEATVVPL